MARWCDGVVIFAMLAGRAAAFVTGAGRAAAFVTDAGRSSPRGTVAVSSARECSAPWPQRQLDNYWAHLAGDGFIANVYARAAATAESDDDDDDDDDARGGWLAVGRVSSAGGEGDGDAGRALKHAAQRQGRLIREYACGLHPPLRASLRASKQRAPDVELGLSVVAGDAVVAVPAASGGAGGGEPSESEMTTAGFVGVPRRGAGAGGIYAAAAAPRDESRVAREEEEEEEEESDGDPEVLPKGYFRDVAYSAAGADAVPWETGVPQPRVVRAARDGRLRGSVLDCGCGLGDNALFLAEGGHADSVVAFDLSPEAVAIARTRAASTPPPRAAALPRFFIASCTALEGSAVAAAGREAGGFDIALDSALLHCLGDDDAEVRIIPPPSLLPPFSLRCQAARCFH